MLTTKWLMRDALRVARKAEHVLSPFGWHVALGGGVMRNGYSVKDLDLIVYPHDASRSLLYCIEEALIAAGWERFRTRDQMHAHWRTTGSTDTKHVEVWTDDKGRRIYLIIVQ